MLISIKGQEILVELKNGETVYGKLTDCDSWMNLTISDVIFNYNNGDKFTKLQETYIRGIHIKSLRLPDLVCTIVRKHFHRSILTKQVMDRAKEQNLMNMEQRNRNQKRRGGGFQRRDGGRDQRNNGNFRGQGRRNYNGH